MYKVLSNSSAFHTDSLTQRICSPQRGIIFFFLLIFNNGRLLVVYAQRILMHTRCLGILVDILWLGLLSSLFFLILDKSSNDQSSSDILQMHLKYSVVFCMMFTSHYMSSHEIRLRGTKNTEKVSLLLDPIILLSNPTYSST